MQNEIWAILPILPIVGAGLSMLFNAGSQAMSNNAQKNWNIDMYNRQRQDALADWKMQNEYNSPAAQMERLKAAGLNPNLVYGNGSATTTASTPRASSAQSYNPKAPQIDANSMFSYIDLQMKQAQTDNVKKATEVAAQDILVKAADVVTKNAQTAKTLKDTELADFSLQQSKRLADINVEMATAQLGKVIADTKYTLDQNERAALQNAQSLSKGVEEILKLRLDQAVSVAQRKHIEQQIENLRSDNQLKKLDIELRRSGIMPSDPFYVRLAGRIVNIDDVKGAVKDASKSVLGGVQIPLQNILNSKKK